MPMLPGIGIGQPMIERQRFPFIFDGMPRARGGEKPYWQSFFSN